MECPFWSNQPRSRETADDEMRPSASQILPNAAGFTHPPLGRIITIWNCVTPSRDVGYLILITRRFPIVRQYTSPAR